LRAFGAGKIIHDRDKSGKPAKARVETDSFGAIEVAGDKYWGAQAQRSLGNFKIGWEKQPKSIVRALGIVKRAAADVNMASAGSTRSSARPSSPPRRK
jgi:fumarate hydratase class II